MSENNEQRSHQHEPSRTHNPEERDRRHGQFSTAEEAMEAATEEDGHTGESAYAHNPDDDRPPAEGGRRGTEPGLTREHEDQDGAT